MTHEADTFICPAASVDVSRTRVIPAASLASVASSSSNGLLLQYVIRPGKSISHFLSLSFLRFFAMDLLRIITNWDNCRPTHYS